MDRDEGDQDAWNLDLSLSMIEVQPWFLMVATPHTKKELWQLGSGGGGRVEVEMKKSWMGKRRHHRLQRSRRGPRIV